MLKNVHIKNLALIEEAEIDFDNGLNIMTGETGSGKSIMISAINIALGDKASKGLIRHGEDHAIIEVTFSDLGADVTDALNTLGFSYDEGLLTITRKITQDASICRINGESASLSSVRMITGMLVDIHGQHDHQSLLSPSTHIDIIDRFGSEEIASLKAELKTRYDQYRELRKKLGSFNMNEEELARETELLEYEKKEIEKAELIQGEDDALEKEYKTLSEWEHLSESLETALIALADEQSGACSKISRAMAEINAAQAYRRSAASGDNASETDDSLNTFKNTITDLDSVARDISHDLSKYIESHRFNRARYDEIRDRLDLINRLKSRYGRTVGDILQYYDSITARLEEHKYYTERKNNLAKRLAAERSALNHAAQDLSDARKKYAAVLEPMIISNLRELNFLTVDFSIAFEKADKISGNGFDRAEFLISVNPGEKLMPLAKIASGGEISRIMLAIKSSVADNDDIPTLIFDEIDTGISGRTAQMVGQKLTALSASHQVICITHLPQIAAMADSHFSIHKEVSDGMTISGIEKLDRKKQTAELARMLGGLEITQASLENAADLISRADEFKTSL